MLARRQKLTEKDCKEIYEETVHQGRDAGLDLCLRKGYKISTFYKCLDNEGVLHPKWKHPDHSTKWSEELIDNACELISSNPLLTLDEIIAEMVDKYNAPDIQKTTLSNYLRFNLISLKYVEYHAAARNSSQTKELRVKYGEWFIEDDKKYIFIDEVGYGIASQRARGRARIGERVVQKLPISKKPNVWQ